MSSVWAYYHQILILCKQRHQLLLQSEEGASLQSQSSWWNLPDEGSLVYLLDSECPDDVFSQRLSFYQGHLDVSINLCLIRPVTNTFHLKKHDLHKHTDLSKVPGDNRKTESPAVHTRRKIKISRYSQDTITFNSAEDELTLPTSTRFVTMTIEAEFSCQTILQKSLTVSCMGPDRQNTQNQCWRVCVCVCRWVQTHIRKKNISTDNADCYKHTRTHTPTHHQSQIAVLGGWGNGVLNLSGGFYTPV